ncbi:hypothetical protein [Nonlabens marinus]|uniref:Lipoprotein n=1 Tax=Nonlabens marinus S1-08 TaxID=1454201 RepID=W8VR06_9FLAO|nr:hypothetical protein [Nonlabens marinus]BAO56014.1 hypothetical protein NMS_2005 [Nonlabens marinus S1-08]
MNKAILGLTILLILFISFSCASSKEKNARSNYSTPESTENMTYSLAIPVGWHSFNNIHGDLSYKPEIYNNRYFKASVLILKYDIKKEPSDNLNDFVEKNYQRSRFYKNHKIEKSFEKTAQGDTYLIRQSFVLNNISYIKLDRVFKIEDEIYVYSYGANNELFSKHLKDSNAMFETLSVL